MLIGSYLSLIGDTEIGSPFDESFIRCIVVSKDTTPGILVGYNQGSLTWVVDGQSVTGAGATCFRDDKRAKKTIQKLGLQQNDFDYIYINIANSDGIASTAECIAAGL